MNAVTCGVGVSVVFAGFLLDKRRCNVQRRRITSASLAEANAKASSGEVERGSERG